MSRNRVITVLSAILMVMCLVSCKTAQVNMGITEDEFQTQISSMQSQLDQMQVQIDMLQSQIVNMESEPTHEEMQEIETVAPEAPEASEEIEATQEQEIVSLPFWEIGQVGPFGGMVFQLDNRCFEIAEPLYEAGSFEDAVAYCESLTSDIEFANEYRLPTVDELLAIYDQLVITEISEIDWTYYWSGEEIDETSAKIVNFDTGFDGKFYKNMDFVSALPICEL